LQPHIRAKDDRLALLAQIEIMLVPTHRLIVC
jgi:hypothetical protein